MTTYTKVSFVRELVGAPGRQRVSPRRPAPVILRDMARKGLFVTGIEVNRFGDEVAGAGYTDRLRVIHTDVISDLAPLVMDNKYGELRAPDESLEAT